MDTQAFSEAMFGSKPVVGQKSDIMKDGKVVGCATIMGIETAYYIVELDRTGKRTVNVEFPRVDRRRIGPIDMMSTQAFHKLGDISRDKPEYVYIVAEDDDNYYGHWVEGMGFVDVRFPKATTRILTPDEIMALMKMHLVMVGAHTGNISRDIPSVVHGYNERFEPTVKL